MLKNTGIIKRIGAVGICGLCFIGGGMSGGGVPRAGAVPLVGGSGLCPNAWSLYQYIRDTYPGVLSIGGVRSDRLPDHPSGHALDIMIGSNMGLGDTIAADIRSQSARFGMKYLLWRVSQHYDHVHVTVL